VALGEATKEGWSSRWGFVLAAMGSAIGLGSIWKFPYEVGEHGGGAFLLFYILGLVLVVLPLLLAEFAIGRRGRGDAAESLARVALESGHRPAWRWVGLLGIGTAFVILTYYAVIAGMVLAYVPIALAEGFGGADAGSAAEVFAGLTRSPIRLAMWQAVFLAIGVMVVARGIRRGVEAACEILMPALFVLMALLVVYALIEGDVASAADFLFTIRLDAETPKAALDALGLGFFSIGVGLGVMITYAAYAGKRFDLAAIAMATLIGDTAVSVLAGLAIFPIVFAEGLDPAEGATLLFLTLPIAFADLPLGDVVGAAFFLMLFLAALASAISIIEIVVTPIIRRTGWSRPGAAILVGVAAWAGGIPSVLSFNLWVDRRPLDWLPGFAHVSVFEAVDGFSSNVLLPLSGLLLSLFAGWRVAPAIYEAELGPRAWIAPLGFLLRWVVPGVIIAYVAAGRLLLA
jgi:NSS family neurotransmitter:Na+ symporter